MVQREFVDWLLYWILETSLYEFEWDEGNKSKNAKKHGITVPEVEAVFRSGLCVCASSGPRPCYQRQTGAQKGA